MQYERIKKPVENQKEQKQETSPASGGVTRREVLSLLASGAAATAGAAVGGGIEKMLDPERLKQNSFANYVTLLRRKKYGPPAMEKRALRRIFKHGEQIKIPEAFATLDPVRCAQIIFSDATSLPVRSMSSNTRKYLTTFLPGVLIQESQLNPYAVSDTGALGLGQFTESGVSQVNNELRIRRSSGLPDDLPRLITKKDVHGADSLEIVVKAMLLHMDAGHAFFAKDLQAVSEHFSLSQEDADIFAALCCVGQYNIGMGAMRNALTELRHLSRADLSMNLHWDYSPQNLYQIMSQLAWGGETVSAKAAASSREREKRQYVALCAAGAELYYSKAIEDIIDRDPGLIHEVLERGMSVTDLIMEDVIDPAMYGFAGVVGVTAGMLGMDAARKLAGKDAFFYDAMKQILLKSGVLRKAIMSLGIIGAAYLGHRLAEQEQIHKLKRRIMETLPWREAPAKKQRRIFARKRYTEEGKVLQGLRFNTSALISKLDRIPVKIPKAHATYARVRNELIKNRQYSRNYTYLNIKQRAHEAARRLGMPRLHNEKDIAKALRAGRLEKVPTLTAHYRVRGVGMGPVGVHEFRNKDLYLHLHTEAKKVLDELMHRVHRRLRDELGAEVSVRFNITGLLRTAALSKGIRQASKASPHEFGLAFDISSRTIDIVVGRVATQFDLRTGGGVKRPAIAKRAFAILMEEMKRMHDERQSGLVLTYHYTKSHYHITVIPR